MWHPSAAQCGQISRRLLVRNVTDRELWTCTVDDACVLRSVGMLPAMNREPNSRNVSVRPLIEKTRARFDGVR